MPTIREIVKTKYAVFDRYGETGIQEMESLITMLENFLKPSDNWEEEFDAKFVDKPNHNIEGGEWWQTNYNYESDATPKKVKDFIKNLWSQVYGQGIEIAWQQAKENHKKGIINQP